MDPDVQGGLIGLLVIWGWCFFWWAIANIEITVGALGELLYLLFRCVWVTLKLAFRVIAWFAVHAWHGAALGFEFLLLLMEEWRRGDRQPADEDEFFRKEEESERQEEFFREREQFFREEDEHDRQEQFFRQEERPIRQAPDPYEQARALFDLGAEFTRAALKQAYRRAIVAAHPDRAGAGSTRAAQEVNGAYDLLLRQRGWSR